MQRTFNTKSIKSMRAFHCLFGLPYVRLASRRPSVRPTRPAEIPALVVGCFDRFPNMEGFFHQKFDDFDGCFGNF